MDLRRLTKIAALFLCAHSLGAATYYMRSDGSAANKGAATGGCGSASTAMSITTHNSQTFSAGDNIVMCDTGGVYSGTIMAIPSSGSNGSPITYSASGNPIISGERLASWTQGTGNPAQDCANGTTPTFCSGMETGGSTFTDWGSRTQTSANITQSTAQVDHGTYSAALTGTGGNNQAYLTTPAFTAWTNNSTHYARVYIYVPSGSLNAGGTQLKWLTPSTGGFVTLDWNGSAVASVSLVGDAGNTFVGTLTTALFTLNTWHYVDVMWVVSSTVGGMQVWIDGTSIGSILNKDTHLDTGATTWKVGMTGTASTLINNGSSVYFDDARFSDTGPIGAFNSGGTYPTSIWATSQSANPYLVDFGANAACTSTPSSCLGTQESSLGAVVANGEWYWDGSANLYVYGVGTSGQYSPATTVGIPALTSVITLSGISYVTFSGLDIRGGLSQGTNATGNGVYASGSGSNLVFNNDTLELNGDNGVSMISTSGNAATISNSTLRYNLASGSQINTSTTGVSNVAVDNNAAYYNCQLASSVDGDHQYCAGIHFYCNGLSGTGTVVKQNLIYSNGIAASVDGQGTGVHIDTCNSTLVSQNSVYSNTGAGIFLEKNVGSTASYNVLYSNASITYEGSIKVKASEGVSAANNNIFNNSIYGGYWGLYVGSYQDGASTITNTIVKNNIVTGSSQGVQLECDVGCANDGTYGSGNVFLNNAFGVAGAGFIFYCENITGGNCGSGSTFATYAAWEGAAGNCGTNGCSNSVQTDPKYGGVPADLTLQTSSPAIGAGANLGSAYKTGLIQGSFWPSVVITASQGSSSWNIGAYLNAVALLSNGSLSNGSIQ